MIDQRWHTVLICHERTAHEQDAQTGREYEKRGRMTPVPHKQGNAEDHQRAFGR